MADWMNNSTRAVVLFVFDYSYKKRGIISWAVQTALHAHPAADVLTRVAHRHALCPS